MKKGFRLKLKRIASVSKKEFIHIRRDRPSLVISFLMPIVMLMLFGFAVNADVNNVALTICDNDNTELSRELSAMYANSYYFRTYNYVSSVAEAEQLLNAGRVKVALVIPEGFSATVKRGEGAKVQLLIDGSDPTIAKTAGSYSMLVANRFSIDITVERLEKSGLPFGASAVVPMPHVLYNPTLESSKFNVPGVVGLILQNITIVLTSLALVREKEIGTIEQLIMTPVTSFEIIIGKLIPYTLIGIYDFTVILVLSNIVFGIKVAGSMAALALLGFIFLVGALAMGMLISTIAKNQAQAIQGTLAFLLPSVLLSGFMFPRDSMPVVIQWIGEAFPVTHFLVILRGIILKGTSISLMKEAAAAMAAIIFFLIALAALKFQKKLD